jgi:glycosyltransferase involved in cell wall biosynthesis
MSRSFTTLPDPGPEFNADLRGSRVCVVSTEIIGPFRNGGVATANTGLARLLAELGAEVTFLYCNVFKEKVVSYDRSFEEWQAVYRRHKIDLVALPGAVGDYAADEFHQARSFAVATFLREQGEFDAVFVDDLFGLAFYALQEKRCGLAHTETPFVLTMHSPHMWLWDVNKVPVPSIGRVILGDLERFCMRNADAVLGPSAYLLNYVSSRGVTLPDDTFVQQYVLPDNAVRVAAGPEQTDEWRAREPGRIKELVFFGRQEVRKGFVLFCDMVDQLTEAHPDVRITVLGRYQEMFGEPSGGYFLRRSERWRNPIRILTELDTSQAIDYLREQGRLAVIPSLADNSPCVVMESMLNGIRFITTGTGGIAELIDQDDHPACVAEPSGEALAHAVATAIEHGIAVPRFAVDPDETRRRAKGFLMGVVRSPRSAVPATDDGPPPAPLVSVCLTHFNQPVYLRQQLEAIAAQDYPNLEVIVLDDGSTDQAAADAFDHLARGFARTGWKFVRQRNRWLGAARNAAVAHSSGEYLVFMDDDNYACPDQVSTLARAATHSGADIVSCLAHHTWEVGPPTAERSEFKYFPLGGASMAAGVATNCYGDANSIFKRSSFERLGGFVEERGFACQDWHLFVRAAHDGMTHLVVPRPLSFYRLRPSGMFRRAAITDNYRPILEAYAETPLEVVQPVLDAVDGQHVKGIRKQFLNDYVQTLPYAEHYKRLLSLDMDDPKFARELFKLFVLLGRPDDALRFAADSGIATPWAAGVVRREEEQQLEREVAAARDKAEALVSGVNRALASRPYDPRYAIPVITPGDDFPGFVARDGEMRLQPSSLGLNCVLLPLAYRRASSGVLVDIALVHEHAPPVGARVSVLDPGQRDAAMQGGSLEGVRPVATSEWIALTDVRSPATVRVPVSETGEDLDVLIAVRPAAGSVLSAETRITRVACELERARKEPVAPEAASFTQVIPAAVLRRGRQLAPPREAWAHAKLGPSGSVILHPSPERDSLFLVEAGAPADASTVSAYVALTHPKASRTECAVWLGHWSESLNGGDPARPPELELAAGRLAWSGWVPITRAKTTVKLSTDLVSVAGNDTRRPLDIVIGTRPGGSTIEHCHAAFSNLVAGVSLAAFTRSDVGMAAPEPLPTSDRTRPTSGTH